MAMDNNAEKKLLFSVAEKLLRQDEHALIATYLDLLSMKYPGALVHKGATELVKAMRRLDYTPSPVELLMTEYNMSHDEGLLLMSLSEALLRTKHDKTKDELVADKLLKGLWKKRSNLFKNWTAYLLEKSLLCSQWVLSSTGAWVGKMSATGIRMTMQAIMRVLADQFVFSSTIEKAILRADSELSKGYRYSFDLLGEASLTRRDAEGFIESYHLALDQLAAVELAKRVKMSLSIKLSAFEPRFEPLKCEQAEENLLIILRPLLEKAKQYQIAITIDAEEVSRLNMIVRVMQRLLMDPVTAGYDGLGCAVQAYTKVAPVIIEQLAQCARLNKRKLHIRLVKGAYWDTEIKEAQMEGHADYPVFTRKEFTDVSYVRCIYALQEHSDVLYAQFGTHNANTVVSVQKIMGYTTPYEFQCLHGMGHALYQHLMLTTGGAINCRIYAPIGDYQELLPYLVRRLLENGANSSFVHHLHDTRITPEAMATDVTLTAQAHLKTRTLVKPLQLFGDRLNSQGIDWSHGDHVSAMRQAIEDQYRAWSQKVTGEHEVFSPNDGRFIGSIQRQEITDLPKMLNTAMLSFESWRLTPLAQRANCLDKAADILAESQMAWAARLVLEAGKTWQDAISEVRESIDFLRYYSREARSIFLDTVLPGPTGESNTLSYHGRGLWLCISPWNFPLAIFTGQVAASLVAGNVVIAKGASQTSLMSRDMIEVFHASGVPVGVLQGLFANAGVAKELFHAKELSGVVMTGGNDSALWMRKALVNRVGPVLPFIAETGGQNVLISDPSAHPDQLLRDVVQSAFRSAGQRCSSLRVWYCHDAVFDVLMQRLSDMMALLVVGSPECPECDIGPLIDRVHKEHLLEHVRWCEQHARLLGRATLPEVVGENYFAPVAYEIDSLSQLTQEWFGPILHVIRYHDEDIPKILSDINATDYGLTMGIHSRIDSFIQKITSQVRIGNTYVNRNMIGATVGVQPFGGEGLSGTGPKAGGPNYLMRFCVERVVTINTAAVGGNASLLNETS